MGEIEHWDEDVDHGAMEEIEGVARRVAAEYVEDLKAPEPERPRWSWEDLAAKEESRRKPEPEPEEIRGSGVGLHGMQISLPESRSVLRIGPSLAHCGHGEKTELMRIESPYPFPGPLRRLVYWVVLGWVWERPS